MQPLASRHCGGCGDPAVEVENQLLTDAVGLTGAPGGLHYASDRVPGRTAAGTLTVPASGATLPPDLKRIEVEVEVAGQRLRQSIDPPEPNRDVTLAWNGQDAYGRPVQGARRATVRLRYVYPGLYQRPDPVASGSGTVSFGRPSRTRQTISENRSRMEASFVREQELIVGGWDARGASLGGWTLSMHHAYDPVSRTLYHGDGSRRTAEDIGRVIARVAGRTGLDGYTGDGGPALNARMTFPQSLAAGEDGALYLADTWHAVVRRVSTDGVITTVATGNMTAPGEIAGFGPAGLAFGPDGRLYIADEFNHRILRLDADGRLRRVAGSATGLSGFAGDGGPATQARLSQPQGVAVAPDGTVFISDSLNHR
ncbi:MAG: RHS repeat-associated core domain-containing protein, partial [Actinomycetota bacterium]